MPLLYFENCIPTNEIGFDTIIKVDPQSAFGFWSYYIKTLLIKNDIYSIHKTKANVPETLINKDTYTFVIKNCSITTLYQLFKSFEGKDIRIDYNKNDKELQKVMVLIPKF